MPDVRKGLPISPTDAGAVEPQAARPTWVHKSDGYAQPIVELLCRFEPERFSAFGVPGVTEQVTQLGPDAPRERLDAYDRAIRTLGEQRARESCAAVRTDLEAMAMLLGWDFDLLQLETASMLPYVNLAQTVFWGFLTLLAAATRDDPASAVRRRLRRYAGLKEGYVPLARQAEALIHSRLHQRDLLGPWREVVLEDLRTGPRLLSALHALFREHRITGTTQALSRLRQQLADYDVFLRREVLPRCRDDFHLPAEVYAARLRHHGVELPIADLSRRAEAAFEERRRQLGEMATRLTCERGWSDEPFPAVLRLLEQEQIAPGNLLDHFHHRHRQLEELITRANLVTLPRRRPCIRFASEAESAVLPFPHFRWPSSFNPCSGSGELVLPTQIVDPGGDYAHQTASWVLAAHELLPGHALQFSRLLEPDISLARGPLGATSTALEGWAVYAGSELSPQLPLEARVFTLYHDLRHAARAFLDPALHIGRLSRAQAKCFLQTRAGFTEQAARQTLWRATVWSPGQATSYFAGHNQLASLRTTVECRLGPSFDRRRYHDLLLSQGMLPLSLLRRTVLESIAVDRQRAA